MVILLLLAGVISKGVFRNGLNRYNGNALLLLFFLLQVETMRICIYGAGAVGLGLASCLIKAGADVDIIARRKTVNKLKKEVKRNMRKKYSDEFFHNTILQAGSIPIKYMRKEFEIRLKRL